MKRLHGHDQSELFQFILENCVGKTTHFRNQSIDYHLIYQVFLLNVFLFSRWTLGAFRVFGQYSLCIGAFLGAIIATVLVFMIARLHGRITPLKMILTGIAVSALFNALTNYIVHSAKNEEGIRTAVYWMIGSFSGAKWGYIPLPLVGLMFAAGTFQKGLTCTLSENWLFFLSP